MNQAPTGRPRASPGYLFPYRTLSQRTFLCLTFASIQFWGQVIRHWEGRHRLLVARKELLFHFEAVQALQIHRASIIEPYFFLKNKTKPTPEDPKKQLCLYDTHMKSQAISDLFSLFDRQICFTIPRNYFLF